MNSSKKILFILLLTFGAYAVNAQIDANSLMGLPRATTVEMNGITSPRVGSILFNTDDDHLYRYTSAGWRVVSLSTLNDNGDGTLTYTNEDGTTTTITLSDITGNGDGTYTFTNGDGTDVTLDTRAGSNPYDNAISGLAATNVQAAIDELVSSTALDADADPTNELSDLQLSGNTLTLTNAVAGATGVELDTFLDNTDDQQITTFSFDGTTNEVTLTLEDGGSQILDLSALNNTGTDDQTAAEVTVADTGGNFTSTDVESVLAELAASNSADGDTDPTNELSDLQLSGNTLTLTNAVAGATGVELDTFLDNTDDQALSLSGNTLTLEDGGTADLTPFLDNTDDQQITTFSFDGATNEVTLTLEDGGSQILDLSALNNTGTDDQTIDVLSMDAGTLNISLEDDGAANQTVALISSDTGNQLVAGSDGALYVDVASSMPVIYATGKINGDGTAASIYGATVSRIDEGDYQVTFNSALANSTYVIQLTILDCNGDCPGNSSDNYDNPGITYYDQTTSGFKVNIGDSDNGTIEKDDIDLEFMFSIIVMP